jgi:hypothetical protein
MRATVDGEWNKGVQGLMLGLGEYDKKRKVNVK